MSILVAAIQNQNSVHPALGTGIALSITEA
jgi:hypothetical protein